MSDKKKSFNLKNIAKNKKLHYGGLSLVLIAVVIAVVVLLNLALGTLETNFALRIDLTSMKATDFDAETYAVMEAVEAPVYIYTVYRPGTQSSARVQIEEIVNKYRSLNANVVVETIDPVSEPLTITTLVGEDKAASVTEGSVIVANDSKSKVKLITPTEYNYNYTEPLTGSTVPLFIAESKITSAVLFVTEENTPVIHYLTGHDEIGIEYVYYIQYLMESNNYEFKTLDLSAGGEELKKNDVLIINSPRRDLMDSEYEILSKWLAAGGRLMVASDIDVNTDTLTNLNRLLSYYQLSFGEGQISESTDRTSNFWQAPYYLVPNKNAEDAITATLTSSTIIVPYARPINPVEVPESGYLYTKLLTTSELATVTLGDGSITEPGEQIVAMTALKSDINDPTNDIRIAMLGSSFLLTNDLMQSTSNSTFTKNLIDWLANRETSVSVAPKFMTSTYLNITDMTTVYVLGAVAVIIIPLVVLIAGIVIWLRRRRL